MGLIGDSTISVGTIDIFYYLRIETLGLKIFLIKKKFNLKLWMIGSCGIVSCHNTPSKLSGAKQFVPAARIYDNIILLFMCILNNFYF